MGSAKRTNVNHVAVWIAVLVLVLVPLIFGTEPFMWLSAVMTALIALVALSAWVAVAIHELGHVIVGWLRGFKTYRVVVFGTVLYTHPVYKGYKQRSSGYVAHFKRGATANDLKWSYLSGPLFSLFAGIGFIAAAVAPFLADVQGLTIWMSGISAMLGILNLHVFWRGWRAKDSPRSDFYKIAKLRADAEPLVNEHRYQAVHLLVHEQRPRDIPEDMLSELSMNPSVPSGYVDIHRYWKLFDAGRIVEAQEPLERAYQWATEQNDGGEYAVSALFEMSMYAARFMEDRDLSDEALEKAQQANPNHYNLHGAMIAREYMWGSKEKALELAEAAYAERIRERSNYSWMLEHWIDWYQQIVPEFRKPSA